MGVLYTTRLELVPITLPLVEAVLAEKRDDVARLAGAKLPRTYPGRALVERGFCAWLDRIRQDPETRLWGDRLMITRDGERCVVGSVVFHGRCDANGVVEVGYGVDEALQGKGLATEAVRASVEWALSHDEVRVVRATTLPWHTASVRVLEKVGMRRVSTEEHDVLGEMLIFERARA